MAEFVEIAGTGLRVLGYALSPLVLLPFAVLGLPGVFGGVGKAVSGAIDWISGAAMGVAVFAAFAIILIQLSAVILRYVFGVSFSWVNDSVIFSFAMIFMLGAAGTLRDDDAQRLALEEMERVRIGILAAKPGSQTGCAWVRRAALDAIRSSSLRPGFSFFRYANASSRNA